MDDDDGRIDVIHQLPVLLPFTFTCCSFIGTQTPRSPFSAGHYKTTASADGQIPSTN